jgi:hypothetical protein
MAEERGPDKTFCPSEIARRLDPDDWRERMPEIRAVAARLVQSGQLRCTQSGKDADPATAHGPIRLGLSPKHHKSS